MGFRETSLAVASLLVLAMLAQMSTGCSAASDTPKKNLRNGQPSSPESPQQVEMDAIATDHHQPIVTPDCSKKNMSPKCNSSKLTRFFEKISNSKEILNKMSFKQKEEYGLRRKDLVNIIDDEVKDYHNDTEKRGIKVDLKQHIISEFAKLNPYAAQDEMFFFADTIELKTHLITQLLKNKGNMEKRVEIAKKVAKDIPLKKHLIEELVKENQVELVKEAREKAFKEVATTDDLKTYLITAIFKEAKENRNAANDKAQVEVPEGIANNENLRRLVLVEEMQFRFEQTMIEAAAQDLFGKTAGETWDKSYEPRLKTLRSALEAKEQLQRGEKDIKVQKPLEDFMTLQEKLQQCEEIGIPQTSVREDPKYTVMTKISQKIELVDELLNEAKELQELKQAVTVPDDQIKSLNDKTRSEQIQVLKQLQKQSEDEKRHTEQDNQVKNFLAKSPPLGTMQEKLEEWKPFSKDALRPLIKNIVKMAFDDKQYAIASIILEEWESTLGKDSHFVQYYTLELIGAIEFDNVLDETERKAFIRRQKDEMAPRFSQNGTRGLEVPEGFVPFRKTCPVRYLRVHSEKEQLGTEFVGQLEKLIGKAKYTDHLIKEGRNILNKVDNADFKVYLIDSYIRTFRLDHEKLMKQNATYGDIQALYETYHYLRFADLKMLKNKLILAQIALSRKLKHLTKVKTQTGSYYWNTEDLHFGGVYGKDDGVSDRHKLLIELHQQK